MYDVQIAALTIYAEASSGSNDERDAIARVVVNRLRSGRFSPTAAGVCLDAEQFSSWNSDPRNRRNLLRAANAPDNDPVMQQCALAFIWARTNQEPDPTRGATHYHDRSIDPPEWTKGAHLTLATENFLFYAGVK